MSHTALVIYIMSFIAGEERFSQYTFALVMFIICMFIKLFGIYVGAHFFSSIGGAYSMEYSLNNAYEAVNTSDNTAPVVGTSHGHGGDLNNQYQQQMQQQMQQQLLMMVRYKLLASTVLHCCLAG